MPDMLADGEPMPEKCSSCEQPIKGEPNICDTCGFPFDDECFGDNGVCLDDEESGKN